MVGKPTRRKQAVSAHTRPENAVVIHFKDFVENVETEEGLTALLCQPVADLLIAMSILPTCSEQIRLLQSQKRKLRASLMETLKEVTEESSAKLNTSLCALVRLYVLPQYFAFQTYLSWLVPCLQDLRNAGVLVSVELSKTCSLVWSDASDAFKTAVQSEKETAVQSAVQYWMPTVNAMMLLDREFQWLALVPSPDVVKCATVEEVVSVLSVVLKVSVEKIVSENASITPTELLLWGNCFTEALRNTMTVIKPREAILADSLSSSSEWEALFEKLVEMSWNVLNFESAPKDALTTAGAAVVGVFSVRKRASESLVEATLAEILGNKTLSSVPTLSVLRAAMTHLSTADLGVNEQDKPFWAVYLPQILIQCMCGNTATELYAFQTLEVWISTLRDVLRRDKDAGIAPANTLVEAMPLLASRISKVLYSSWGHSARQISHIIPTIFDQFLRVAVGVLPFTQTEASASSIAAEFWRVLVVEATRMPDFHRGKYQALKLLVDTISASAVMSLNPTIVNDLMVSLKDRTIAASVSSLFCSLVTTPTVAENASNDEPPMKIAKKEIPSWKLAVISALSSDIVVWRQNTADYLLPDLLRLNRSNAADLLDLSLEEVSSVNTLSEGRLWCVTQIVLNARQLGLPLVINSADLSVMPPLAHQAICLAMESEDDDLRLVALMSMTASLKATTPMQQADFTAFQNALHWSMKSSDVDDCSKVARAVKSLLLRVKSNLKPTPETTAALASAEAAGVAPTILVGREFAEKVLSWLLETVQSDIYPGVPYDREYSSLSVLSVVFSVFDPSEELLSGLLTASTVRCLIHAFLSSWDRSRRLASELIVRLPKPWPGHETAEAIRSVVDWARGLAHSARLRESDAGAQILCAIFRVYCVELATDCFADALSPETTQKLLGDSQIEMTPVTKSCVSFFAYVWNHLTSTLAGLDIIFSVVAAQSRSGPSDEAAAAIGALDADFPLAHGLFLATRLSLQALNRGGVLRDTTNGVWRGVCCALLNSAQHALNLAMTVVAESPCDSRNDVAIAGAPETGGDASMAASYVNTNSFMGSADKPEGDADAWAESLGAKAQRAIVAAWLLVKESLALMASLVEVTPVPPRPDSSDAVVLLSSSDVETIGDTILDALGRLKHMGAIAEAHVALQAVASVLLRYGEDNSYLCGLPSQWLRQLLRRLDSRQQVFILRRSAGFAYSFVSLLRAEPLNTPPVLLHEAVSTLLSVVDRGLFAGDALKATEVTIIGEENWKMSIHALNVLRMILLDGAFGADLDAYVPEMLRRAVLGFSSGKWAVRNSSMMVFSAAVTRAIAKNKSDSGGADSVTATDFFNRHPALLPFLLKRLDLSSKHYLSEGEVPMDTDANTGGGEECLFPLLLLLAKFRPTLSVSDELTAASPEAEGHVVEEFLPLIARSLRSPIALVRAMASKAFSAILPLSTAHESVNKLITAFPTEAKRGANAAHGALQQLLEVLTQVRRHQAFIAGTNETLARVAAELCSSAQLMRPILTILRQLRCPHLHVAFHSITKVARQVVGEVQGLEWQSVAVSAAADVATLYLSNDLYNIQVAPYAPHLLKVSFEDLVEITLEDYATVRATGATLPAHLNFVDLLTHPLREIREGIARGMISAIASKDISTVPAAASLLGDVVLPVLANYLQNEVDPDVGAVLTELVLVILRNVTTSSLDKTSYDLLVSSLLARISGNTGTKDLNVTINVVGTLAGTDAALEAFSLLVAKSLSESSYNEASILLQRLVEAALLAVQPDRLVDLRIGAVRALGACGLLKPNTVCPAHVDGSVWGALTARLLLSSVSLLQDDDSDVRDSFNDVLSRFLGSTNVLPASNLITLERLVNALANSLSSTKDASLIADLLSQWQQALGSVEELRRVLSVDARKDLSRRIFEAEATNIYIEDLESASLLSNVLAKQSVEVHDSPLVVSVLQLAIETASHLVTTDHSSTVSAGVVGGVAYYPEAFRLLRVASVTTRALGSSAGPTLAPLLESFQNLMPQLSKFHPALK